MGNEEQISKECRSVNGLDLDSFRLPFSKADGWLAGLLVTGMATYYESPSSMVCSFFCVSIHEVEGVSLLARHFTYIKSVSLLLCRIKRS